MVCQTPGVTQWEYGWLDMNQTDLGGIRWWISWRTSAGHHYQEVKGEGLDLDATLAFLNSLGMQGWEVVTADRVYLLKRPLRSTP